MAAVQKRTTAEAGVNYLKGSKVGSTTGYLCVGGTIVGLPHGRRATTPRGTTPRGGHGTPRFNGLSESGSQFREMPYCYASMDRKPLTPYAMHSHRSRLAVDDAPVPYKNASTIEFNGGIHTCHKKRFMTTNSLAFTGEPCDPRSNPGIVSESVKFQASQRLQ